MKDKFETLDTVVRTYVYSLEIGCIESAVIERLFFHLSGRASSSLLCSTIAVFCTLSLCSKSRRRRRTTNPLP